MGVGKMCVFRRKTGHNLGNGERCGQSCYQSL